MGSFPHARQPPMSFPTILEDGGIDSTAIVAHHQSKRPRTILDHNHDTVALACEKALHDASRPIRYTSSRTACRSARDSPCTCTR